MTEIINGQLVYNELTAKSNGGTELMARRMANTIDKSLLEGFQIIHSRVRELQPDLKKILVCHDLATDPEVQRLKDPEFRAQFEKIVFVSNWQQQMYNLILGVPYSQSIVIPNGIELPSQNIRKHDDGPIELIYHTTPHRGLAIVADVMPELSKRFDIHLSVFSSFKAYGWEQRDSQFANIFEQLENMPNVINYGYQSNQQIRKHLNHTDVFVYPSIWQETSCLALIEAMCFGLWCVHSNLAALPETSGGLTTMYNYDEDMNRHAQTFFNMMFNVLNIITNNRRVLKDYGNACAPIAQHRFDWQKIKKNHWQPLLESMK